MPDATPSTTRASYRAAYGPPECLRIAELPVPAPREGEILVRVGACTVNRTDYALLTGRPFVFRFFTGLLRPRLPITGTDFAGEVVAAGPQASFDVGQRVFGFRDEGLGTHAELARVPCSAPLAATPEGIDDATAVAGLEGGHYALNFLDKVEVRKGARTLVNGATGAIGSALVQLLKHEGATVVATAPGSHLDVVRELGADAVIDYERESFTEVAEGPFDLVLDAVGKSSFGACRRLLSRGGTYLSSELGPGGENLYLPILTRFSRERVVFPMPSDIPRSLERLRGLLASGAFRPLVDRRYPLDRIADAFRYVNTGRKIGNVLVVPSM